MNAKSVTVLIAVLFVAAAVIAYESVHAQIKADGQQTRAMNADEQIQALVRNFLNGAGANDVEAHDRFWASDLIYTGSSGAVKTKPEIMKSVRDDAAHPNPKDPKMTYTAEDMTVHNYGDFAVVNFRLVAHNQSDARNSYYRNTGTLRRQNGNWKVIAWQATKIEKQ